MDCQKVYSILMEFIRYEIKESKMKGVVIGESGGIDSALSTVLAIDSLGKDAVHTILMPFGELNKHYWDAIEFVCKNGIFHAVVPIDEIYEAYYRTGIFYHSDAAKENTLVRIRTNLLRGHASEKSFLYLGTSNASEVCTGHFTKGGGDGSADISPLHELTKGRIYELVEYVNSLDNGMIIHEEIITKKPTPDLHPNMCDEDYIGPYKYVDQMVDKIKYGTVPVDVPKEYEKKFYGLFNNSAHKRSITKYPDIPYIYVK